MEISQCLCGKKGLCPKNRKRLFVRPVEKRAGLLENQNIQVLPEQEKHGFAHPVGIFINLSLRSTSKQFWLLTSLVKTLILNPPLPLLNEGPSTSICRHCYHYIVNPFTQWCSFQKREVEATDSCKK